MLENTSLLVLFIILFVLLVLSAFFSASETSLMAINRYRLAHLAQEGHRGAMLAEQLLSKPDRLITLILLGNNFVNIFASSIATIIGIKLYGEQGIVIATFALTLIILLFAEVSPKTLAALHPERVALRVSYIIKPLQFILYPLVWFTNIITSRILKLFGVSSADEANKSFNTEELRVALMEAGSMIPARHKDMLMSILDLEKITVNDVMIARNEIEGLDISQPFSEITKQLSTCAHSRLIVYKETMDNLVGIIHIRKAVFLLAQNNLTLTSLKKIIRDPYYIPEGTALNTQLINFQRNDRQTGLVVDEYGDLLGLLSLEDIFLEIVGKFTPDNSDENKEIYPQSDGSYLITGSTNIRDINRLNQWTLPTNGPVTINGLVLEHLENIPDSNVTFRLNNYIIEVVEVSENSITKVRLRQLDDAVLEIQA